MRRQLSRSPAKTPACGISPSLLSLPRPEILDGSGEAFLEGHLGFPAEEIARLRDVGSANLRIIDGEFFMHDLGPAVGEAQDGFGKLEDGQFGGVANVNGFMLVGLHETVNAVDEIRHLAETAGL